MPQAEGLVDPSGVQLFLLQAPKPVRLVDREYVGPNGGRVRAEKGVRVSGAGGFRLLKPARRGRPEGVRRGVLPVTGSGRGGVRILPPATGTRDPAPARDEYRLPRRGMPLAHDRRGFLPGRLRLPREASTRSVPGTHARR